MSSEPLIHEVILLDGVYIPLGEKASRDYLCGPRALLSDEIARRR